jgi:hypothetical protein
VGENNLQVTVYNAGTLITFHTFSLSLSMIQIVGSCGGWLSVSAMEKKKKIRFETGFEMTIQF